MLASYNLITEKSKAKYLWKFVDINKFLSMLQNKDLHFSQLNNLNDIFEGANVVNSLSIHLDYINGFLPPFQRNKTMPNEVYSEKQESFKGRISALKKFQQNFFADCFFQGEEESVAMWNSYSLDNGIAIQFNSEFLFEDILNFYKKNLSDDFELGYGPISYEKLTNPPYNQILEGNIEDFIFEPFKKDIFHSYENEFRFIFHRKNESENNHIKVKIDLSNTIQRFIAHPNSPDWVIEAIYKLVVKYDLIKEVQKSRIITSEMASKIL